MSSYLFDYVQVCNEDVTPDLASPVGGVLLTLMASLRECILSDETQSIPQLLSAQYVQALDGSMMTGVRGDSHQSLRGLGVEVVALTSILKELLKFIIISGGYCLLKLCFDFHTSCSSIRKSLSPLKRCLPE